MKGEASEWLGATFSATSHFRGHGRGGSRSTQRSVRRARLPAYLGDRSASRRALVSGHIGPLRLTVFLPAFHFGVVGFGLKPGSFLSADIEGHRAVSDAGQCVGCHPHGEIGGVRRATGLEA
jgi:hypothetical protein